SSALPARRRPTDFQCGLSRRNVTRITDRISEPHHNSCLLLHDKVSRNHPPPQKRVARGTTALGGHLMAAAESKVAAWPAIPTAKPEEVYAGLSDQAKAYPLFLESILRPEHNFEKPEALSRLRVLDCTTSMMIGHWCSSQLSELGAEVIQVEPPGGDPLRKLTPFGRQEYMFEDKETGEKVGAQFLHEMRNKSSVTLNVATEEGRKILRDLAIHARSRRMPAREDVLRRQIQRNIHAEGRSRRRRLLHRNIAAVVLQNLLHHGQSHPRPILLAMTDKGLEQPVAHRLGNSRPVILDANLKALPRASQLDVDFAGFRGHGLARIEQQVQQGAFHFLEVEPAFRRAVAGNPYTDALEFRMRFHALHGSIDRRAHIAVARTQRLSCAGEFQQ